MSHTRAIAVRTLCEFAARKGSLDNRYTPSPSAEDGRIAHKTVQQGRPDGYRAEYPLEGVIAGLRLRGRADGYYPARAQNKDSLPTLEEIKSHRGKVDKLNSDRRYLHWAQLKVYGALICLRDGITDIVLQLCYIDIDNGQETLLQERYCADDLLAFCEPLCTRYQQWHQQEEQHRLQRDKALRQLPFCYSDFRLGQRQLAEDAYKTVATAKISLIEAPTGLGKTLGVLFPNLLGMVHHDIDRLFLLSQRNPGKRLWADALQQLLTQTKPPPLRVVQLESRQNSCDNPELACHGESCPLAQGFFDKLPQARQEAAECGWLNSENLANIARKHGICRYFLGQEMARWSDVVIGDINHYFDQQALLYVLLQQNDWRVSLCIDEAHNTLDRARGMLSAVIDEQDVCDFAKNAPASLKGACNSMKRAWRNISQEQPRVNVDYLDQPPMTLVTACQQFASKAADYMVDHPGSGPLQELMFSCLSFVRLAESFADHSVVERTLHKPPRSRVMRAKLAIKNIDPSSFLKPRWEACHSAVVFSATLQPFSFYGDVLGIRNAVTRQISTPFKRDQIELRIVSDIDTRYQYRQQSAASIAQRIAWQASRKPGNYLVYTPSFAYQALLEDALKNLAMSINVITQQRSMNEYERETFIEQFRQEQHVIGLATMGGIFGEGIDLPGEALIGVFIISLGLPPFDEFHSRIENYFSSQFGRENGYRYTYLYPAIRKVAQAAGRLIRTEQDQGVIELIDPRFELPEIKPLLPSWWF